MPSSKLVVTDATPKPNRQVVAAHVPIQDRPWLTVGEVAGLTGKSPSLIYQELEPHGRLKWHDRGGNGRKMIKRSDMEDWMEGRY